MGVLADWQLKALECVTPFEPGVKRPGKISYGVTSYGYDIRASYKWKLFTNTFGAVVDPKSFNPKAFIEVDLTPREHRWELFHGSSNEYCAHCNTRRTPVSTDWPMCGGVPDHVLIPPNSFALCESMERFRVPRDCLCVVIGKSTYARCGIVLNCTPLEPEWEGNITLELSNTTPLPAKVYANEGVGQVLFFRCDDVPCQVSYADKKGKYQDQSGVTLPKVD